MTKKNLLDFTERSALALFILCLSCQQNFGCQREVGKNADAPLLLKSQCPENSLSMMTFNIHYGKNASEQDRFVYLQEYLREKSAAVVFLQELDKNTVRSGRRDQFALLKEASGYAYGHFEELIPWDGGTYGIAILSKYPLENLRIIDLDVDDSLKNAEYERRGAIHAQIVVNGQRIHLVNTHWAYSSPWREIQADILTQALRSELSGSEPLVFAGDLNVLPDHELILNLKASLTDSWEQVASVEPERRIDYIFSRNLPAPCSATLDDTGLSDHLPYEVRFPLP